MTVLDFPATATSPFDAIKQVRADGSEFWSARDLMTASGYDRWENFSAVVTRAAISAANQGYVAADHFRDAAKVMPGGRWGEQTVTDVELSRLAAYLVFQNGDPRKPEIAAAQGYFAVRTREAEVTAALDPSTGAGALALAERYLDAARALVAAEQRVKALEGPAAQAETFRQAEGKRTVGDLANDFKVYAASRFPGVKVLHQDVRDHAGRLDIVIRGNTVRANQPTARAIEAGWAVPHRSTHETNTRGTQTTVTTHLTPKGEARLWDGLIAYIHEHGSLAIAKEVAR
ncbi:MAG: phage antirepressor KilAC domain-containing protein [Micrococcales bacterium]|nr:phage antirepressor KilAC domain-containing protein [Micrococcales bacterium]